MTTIREALDEWGREAILVFFLTASWRKPIDYSDETMAQAAARRDTLRNAFTLEPAPVGGGALGCVRRCARRRLRHAGRACRAPRVGGGSAARPARRGLEVFGLGSLAARDEAPPEVVELAERRSQARAERDFETSDRLRDELAGLGWQMRDEPGGGYTLVR